MSWTCGTNCEALSGYTPFFATIIDVLPNMENFSFAMLVNEDQQRFVTSFRGTVGNVEAVIEVLESLEPTIYSLHSIPGALVDSYFYVRYVEVLRPIIITYLLKA